MYRQETLAPFCEAMTNESQHPPLLASFSLGEASYEGRVLSTGHGSIRVQFGSIGPGTRVPMRTRTPLTISGGNLEEPLVVEGSASRWHSDGETEDLYFLLEDEEVARIDDALRAHRSIRIPIRGGAPVLAQLETLEKDVNFDAVIVDVSASGLAVILPAKDDVRLCESMARVSEDRWLLTVDFQLPGAAEKLQVVGEVRYRAWTNRCIKYGIRIVPERTEQRTADFPAAMAEQLRQFEQSLKAA